MPHRSPPAWLAALLLLASASSAAGTAITEPDAIRQAALAALGAEGTGSEATVDPALRMARCGQPLQAVPTSPRTVEVRCDDAPGWRLYVPVRLRREADVVVLKTPARAGVPITADQLAVQRRDMSGEGAGFSDPAQLIGRLPRLSLPRGAALTEADLATGALLRRGDPVVLVSRAGGVEVRVAGRALGKATPGGTVSVENIGSRRVVRGRLIEEGVVEVTR
ncbi:flagellar basal body P-ring formation chaperone FlgA [Lysobacter sp. D1-1-M9]|uniref:flagellar basal body P-ring formation chaperone FlgA n=1 Tax=Novilysobacter longmucuonensis TaxID=3098603 RepID=UPI002FC74DDF